jgi:hypothetical protein
MRRRCSDVVSSLTVEEDWLVVKMTGMANKHEYDLEQNYLRIIMIEDVNQLEDVFEAVVTGVLNLRHAVYHSAKAGLTHVASYTF